MNKCLEPAREGRVNRIFATALCLVLLACTAPKADTSKSLELYNRGETDAAIELLLREPIDHYEVANLLALYYVSAGYQGDRGEFAKADSILQTIETPNSNQSEIAQYLDFLRFLSASNAGRAVDARRIWQPYCGSFQRTQKHFDCLRLTYITIAALTERAYYPGTRMHSDLVAMAKAGYYKTYNWDPTVFQNRAEHEAFVERSLRQIEAREAEAKSPPRSGEKQ